MLISTKPVLLAAPPSPWLSRVGAAASWDRARAVTGRSGPGSPRWGPALRSAGRGGPAAGRCALLAQVPAGPAWGSICVPAVRVLIYISLVFLLGLRWNASEQ